MVQFFSAVHKFIPVKTVKDVNSPPWIDREVRYFKRKKYSALNKYRKPRTDNRKQKLRELSQAVKNLVKRKHLDYLLRIQDSYRDNPNLFWSYHKAVFHHRLAKTSSDKAELFNSYFSFVFQPSRTKQDQVSNFYMTQSRFDFQLYGRSSLVNEKLPIALNYRASGPDGIPARLLKECSNQIAPSPCCFFNLSLSSSLIPSEWKSSDVIPVHRKESKKPAENYGPISLLPIVSKVLERCVYQRFYDHVAHVVSEYQHGFFRNRSW